MAYRRGVEPQPCYVIEGEERWRGTVLAWRKDDAGGWVGVVRFMTRGDLGPMQYEHALPAERLLPRDDG